MTCILLINGPNLNLLGKREPEIYGSTNLNDIEGTLRQMAQEQGVVVETFQSNHEGAIIDRIHEAKDKVDCIIINPGAYTHTSIALADAISAVGIPTIEVHISNIYRREPFRHHSHIAPVAVGQVSGFGVFGYQLAMNAALDLINNKK